jgi:hypothetical protein
MLKVLDGSAGYGKPLTAQEIKDFSNDPGSQYLSRDLR